MQERSYTPESIVVLTTQERFNLFGCIVGAGVDARFDPALTLPLHDFLANCAASGARLVILDEAHFVRARDLVEGLTSYLDDAQERPSLLDFIVVCSQRQAGDALLAHLVTYCGLYDIVYGCEGAALSAELSRLIRHPNTRHDVLELLQGASREHPWAPQDAQEGSTIVRSFDSSGEKIHINIEITCK